ncbi:hypothetical protein B0H11DRAFT_1921609 [Mycena galericulata]|nr:hypothetical protein B0H11DRAFT_1921609 [Mycena galericulata]
MASGLMSCALLVFLQSPEAQSSSSTATRPALVSGVPSSLRGWSAKVQSLKPLEPVCRPVIRERRSCATGGVFAPLVQFAMELRNQSCADITASPIRRQAGKFEVSTHAFSWQLYPRDCNATWTMTVWLNGIMFPPDNASVRRRFISKPKNTFHSVLRSHEPAQELRTTRLTIEGGALTRQQA